jgi:hypothetical protein
MRSLTNPPLPDHGLIVGRAELVGASSHHPSRVIPRQAGSVGAGWGVVGFGVAVGGTNQQTAEEPSQAGRGVSVGRGGRVATGVIVARTATTGRGADVAGDDAVGSGPLAWIEGAVGADDKIVVDPADGNALEAKPSRSTSAVTANSSTTHGSTVAHPGRPLRSWG